MPSLNLSRWAFLGVKDETGTGRLGQDLKRCLQPIRHLVTPSYRHTAIPLEANEEWLAVNGEDRLMREQFSGLQGIIFVEDTDWSQKAVRIAYELGIKTVSIVLWEWLRPYVKEWQLCDLLVCPNHFGWQVARKLGFQNAAQLTWPVNMEALPQRAISGPARCFVHNGGLLEKDDRKGTAITLQAFAKLQMQDVKMLLRVQNDFSLPVKDSRIKVEARHLESHADLYRVGDVAVQPSKCEGLGFMLLEAIASGMPVLTTDYPPMNEYVRHKTMLASTRWGKYPAEQTSYVPQAHFKIPRVSSLAAGMLWCARNDLEPVSRANRLWAEEMFDPARVRREWTDVMQRLVD